MLTVIPWFGQALYRLDDKIHAAGPQDAPEAGTYDFLLRQDNTVLTAIDKPAARRSILDKRRHRFVPRVLTAGLY